MDDRRFMDLALDEAREAEGRTSPNPPVGAVVVRDGKVVSVGHTAPAGGPHAEIVALRGAGELAKGATLYTTLEPCSHQGRTGPCTDAILEAGIGRVVVGSIDQNPLVAGQGVERLRAGGVDVATGVREPECERHNAPFFTWVRKGRPHVVLKAAATLDGRIATRTGDSKWITGEAARARVHAWRDRMDAILVGAGTVRADDPRLTARPAEGEGRDPIRVVLDGSLSTSPRARVYRQASSAPTWLVTSDAVEPARLDPWLEAGIDVIRLPAPRGRIPMGQVVAELARRNVVTLLVEGGSEVHGSFLESGLVDEVRLFLAPKLVGEGPSWVSLPAGTGPARVAEGWRIEDLRVERLGEDLLVSGRPVRG